MTIPTEMGASSDGFKITVLPHASGGATVRQARLNAPFHGENPATTPRGWRWTTAVVLGASTGSDSPAMA